MLSFRPTSWSKPDGWAGTLEQAWFPGVHSNVGGGYKPDGLANEALHWMLTKAQAVGLEVDWTYLDNFEPHFESVLHDSMSFKYRLFGPGTRSIGAHEEHGECIHDAAIKRMGDASCSYAPGNLDDTAKRLPVVETERNQ